jgi:hypothetical protein
MEVFREMSDRLEFKSATYFEPIIDRRRVINRLVHLLVHYKSVSSSLSQLYAV